MPSDGVSGLSFVVSLRSFNAMYCRGKCTANSPLRFQDGKCLHVSARTSSSTYSHLIVTMMWLHRFAPDSLMLPTTILVPPIILVSSVYQSHIVIALVKARNSPAMDELSNIAPRFVELAVTLGHRHIGTIVKLMHAKLSNGPKRRRKTLIEASTHGSSGS